MTKIWRADHVWMRVWVAIGLVWLGIIEAPAQTNAARPNILLILADDLGFSDLGCYGSEVATPNLDKLASGGVRFTQFYNSARCCPTRASILTGLHPHQAGMGDMEHSGRTGPRGYEGHLMERCVTIPEVLKPAGYHAYMVGKWHLGRQPNPVERGFEEFYGMIGGFNTFWEEHPHYTRLPQDHARREYAPGKFYSTDVFGDYALDFLTQARQSPGQPWFLYLAFNAAHFPLHAPEAEIAKYEAVYAQGWDRIRAQRFERQKQLGLLPQGTVLTPRSLIPANWANQDTGWANKDNPPWDSLPAARRADLARRMAVYAAMIDRMDQNIGRVVTDLRQHKELENTLIVFLSDNGACAEWDPYGFDGESGPHNTLHQGDDLKTVGGPASYVSYGSGWANVCNTPWRLYKHYDHEGGIAAPCIVHWPRGLKRPGQLEAAPSYITDLMATFVEVSGATYPQAFAGHDILPMEGRSLLPALQGQAQPERTLCFEHEGNRAVRQRRWKLVSLSGQPWELYNFEQDRSELHNLAAQQPERVARLAEAWEQWAERCWVRRPKPAVATPQIGGKALTISCAVAPAARDGVILAQGGTQQGYALWLRGGKLVFGVRVNKALTSIVASETPSGPFTVTARLKREGAMELAINGQTVAQGQGPGLIPVQPLD
ncbi:MAG TPA: arylsulfatase, partial [Bacillota bacterium]|nr:arylsulfatase [Bacillota bacterium]